MVANATRIGARAEHRKAPPRLLPDAIKVL
jgi:hypothetical protein